MILTERQLVRWGERIGGEVHPPFFLAIRGPLGAGKSVLARAVARGAGVEGPLPSPTFNLVFRYQGATAEVIHVDLYRIHDPRELKELGWEELCAGEELLLVEWPERAGVLLPADRWEVELRAPEGTSELREVMVRKVGSPPSLPSFPMALSPYLG
jgi:tRNA threonylcarbamoyl adenosine modification protein YjeE